MKFCGARALLLAISLFAVPSGRADEIVYENSRDYLGKHATLMNEYGDEITLGGVARTVTEFLLEYTGDFVVNGDEFARVRFYANDGGPWANPNYILPSTLLWESPLVPIATGDHTMRFGNMVVPLFTPASGWLNSFTFTVQFFGLTGNTTPGQEDIAGLRFFGLAHIGFSYNDFWQRRADGWSPVAYGPTVVAKNNFGARVLAAVPEPSTVALATFGAIVGLVHFFRRKSNGPRR